MNYTSFVRTHFFLHHLIHLTLRESRMYHGGFHEKENMSIFTPSGFNNLHVIILNITK